MLGLVLWGIISEILEAALDLRRKESLGLQLEDRRMAVYSGAEIGMRNIRLMRTVMNLIRLPLLAMVITGALLSLPCVPLTSAVAVRSCSLIRRVHPMHLLQVKTQNTADARR